MTLASHNGAPPCAAPDAEPRAAKLTLPGDACDCHAHVIGPAREHPFVAQRVYTPPDCLYSAYRHMLDTIGVERAVLVQPSVYGTDNTVLLNALQRDPQRLRGVAVVDADIPDSELSAMHAAGVRGVRVNLVDRHDRHGALPVQMLHALTRRIAPLGWHLELLVHVDEHASELAALATCAVPVVFGHFGYMSQGADVADEGFRTLVSMMRGGQAWVKLTGPYRLGLGALPYEGCAVLAQALVGAAPHRVLWGTDWPHVMLKGAMPNDAELVNLLEAWLPDAAHRQQVLVDNPAQLYGFDA